MHIRRLCGLIVFYPEDVPLLSKHVAAINSTDNIVVLTVIRSFVS